LAFVLAVLVVAACAAALGGPSAPDHGPCLALKGPEPSVSKAVSPGPVAALAAVALETPCPTAQPTAIDVDPVHRAADVATDRPSRSPPTHS
jgi:hypothetical protein